MMVLRLVGLLCYESLNLQALIPAVRRHSFCLSQKQLIFDFELEWLS